MKRFKYDEKYGTMKKLNYKIAFPLEIKIAAVNSSPFHSDKIPKEIQE